MISLRKTNFSAYLSRNASVEQRTVKSYEKVRICDI